MPYETDERLKGYLDTSQMYREQLCLAVLAVDRRFSDVRPRHPRGGPDGARDIEAVFNDVQRVFGAVGFLNQATDSDEHKKRAINKFTDDLTEALKQEPRPEVFIFLTNVNLTVGQKDELVKNAKTGGLAHAEIFDRERIRIVLDGADGFSLRYQYLGLPLSDAEQATFFARWGSDIQGLISDGFGTVEKALNRIHFLQEATLPLNHLTVVMELDKVYCGAEISHFRAFSKLQFKSPINGLLNILFGAADNSDRLNTRTEEGLAKGRTGIAKSICGGQWELRIPVQQPQRGQVSTDIGEDGQEDNAYRIPHKLTRSFTSVGQNSVKDIRIGYENGGLVRYEPVPRLIDLEECIFVFFLNRSLAEKVKVIKVYANAYKLTEIGTAGFNIDYSFWEVKLPFFFSAKELSDPWVRLRPKIASAFHIKFSEQTPKRFYRAIELPDVMR